MKKSFLFAAIILSLSVSAQSKDSATKQPVDTLYQISLKLNDFRTLLDIVEKSFDSRKQGKDVIDFLLRSTQLVQVANKPKQPK